MFGLYTRKQVEREIEKAQYEDYRRREREARLKGIEKRLWRLEHGADKLAVGEAIKVCAEDCAVCCPDEDFG